MRRILPVLACVLLFVGDAGFGDDLPPRLVPLEGDSEKVPAADLPVGLRPKLSDLGLYEDPAVPEAPRAAPSRPGATKSTPPTGPRQRSSSASAPVGTFPMFGGAAPNKSVATAAAPASSVARRRQVEALLDAPLDLPLNGRKTITLAEFAEHLRDAHGLSLRLDVPTLRATIGAAGSSSGGASPSRAGAGSCCPSVAVPMTLPPRVSSVQPTVTYRPGAAAGKSRPIAPNDEPAARAADLVRTYAEQFASSPLPAGSGEAANDQRTAASRTETRSETNGTAEEEEDKTRLRPASAETPAAAPPSSASSNSASPSVWLSDLDAASAEAKRRDVALVVLFRADWCGPCRKLEAETLTDPEIVRTLRRDVVAVRLDVDGQADLAKRHQVNAVPSLLVLDAGGKELSRTVGLIDKAAVLKRLAGTRDVASTETGAGDGTVATDNGQAKACPAGSCPAGSCPAEACPSTAKSCCPACPSDDDEVHGEFATALLEVRVPVSVLGLENARVGSALQQLLQSLNAVISEGEEQEVPLPIRLTRAGDLDFLVQDDGLLVTSRLAANIRKETRVYHIPNLPDCTSEKLARIITRTVRPWSWRSQATEMAEGLASKWTGGFRLPGLSLDLTDGVKMASGAVRVRSTPKKHGAAGSTAGGGATPAPVNAAGGEEAADPTANDVLSPEALNALNALGQFAIHGAATFLQGGLSLVEIAHHGDPPTAVIETLPSVLVITQSQAAHREIADLLEQLGATPAAMSGGR